MVFFQLATSTDIVTSTVVVGWGRGGGGVARYIGSGGGGGRGGCISATQKLETSRYARQIAQTCGLHVWWGYCNVHCGGVSWCMECRLAV